MSKLKISLIILAIGCLFLLIGIIALPTMLSTPRGKTWALHRINAHIAGDLTVEEWSFSWFGKQQIVALSLKDSSGKDIFNIHLFETDTPLIAFLRTRPKLGATLLERPYLYLATEQTDETNLEQALQGTRPTKSRFFPTPRFTGSLMIQGGELLFASHSIKPVTIFGLQFTYQPEQDLFHLQAQTNQDGISGEIFASGNLAHQLHVLTKITNFPIAILDQIRGDTLCTTAIGETMDCNIETVQQAESYAVIATLSSAHLNGTIKTELVNHNFIFSPESELIFNLTPSTFHALIGPTQKKQWNLTATTPIVFHIEEGTIPATLKKWNLDHIQCTLSMSMERAELIHHLAGPYTFSDLQAMLVLHQQLHAHLAGRIIGKEESHFLVEAETTPHHGLAYHISSQGFPFKLLDLAMDESETFGQFLGDTVSLDVRGTYDKEAMQATLHLYSPSTQLEAALHGSLDTLSFEVKGNQLLVDHWSRVLGQAVTFELDGEATLWQKNLAITTLKGRLHNEMVDLSLQGRLGEPGKPIRCDQIFLTMTGKLLELPYLPDVTLKQGAFSLILDGKENLMTGKAQVVVSIDLGEDRIDSKTSEIEFSIQDLLCNTQVNLKQSTIWVQAKLQHFPTAILNLLTPTSLDLTLLAGPTLDATLRVSYNPHDLDHLAIVDIDATSEALKIQAALAIDGTLEVRQPQPAFLSLTLTPQRYQALMTSLDPNYHSEFSLISSPTIEIALSEFKCPIDLPKTFSTFLCQSGVVGSIQVSPMIFRRQNDVFSIERIAGLIQAQNFSKSISVNLESALISSAVPPNERSSIHIIGNIQNLWDHSGTLSHQGMRLNGEIDIQLLPVRQLLSILPMDPEARTTLSALLGDSLNARLYGDIAEETGPLTIDLKSSNFKALLPLQLTPTAILLRNTVNAEITLTEEVSEILLVDVNPLFITGAVSDHPLKLTIDPAGFSIALHPFFFKGVNIENALLDIGKISVHNGGEIQALMEFLKASEIENQWMEAWFTPIFMSLREGTSFYQRFDLLLAESVHLAFWGEIDLVKNKVHMTLGIAPSTLAQRFNIKGLTKTEMFQVKMRGKTNNVELDWSSAYRRIGIIVARATGSLGYLIGGVLEQLLTVLGDEATPPPTTTPLPWQEPNTQ